MNQQPPQKPTVEERITDAIFKIITAGSGGYALYNIATDDLPKAAIAAFETCCVKNQAIKQSMMQQLLTSYVRLTIESSAQ